MYKRQVDPEVLVKRSERELKIGQFYQVEVTNADDFDLYAKSYAKYKVHHVWRGL